jgi:hypothetical protein
MEKTMKHSLIVILILGTTIFGCSTGVAPTEPRLPDIYGNWQWVKSVGGFAGTTVTPATAGYTQRVVLKSGNTCEYYKNDTLMTTAQFAIYREKTSFSSDSVDVIHYLAPVHFFDQIVSQAGSDTLALADLCMDCFKHTYVRIK